MPSTAGRLALVKLSGTPTAFTGEATTVLTTDKVYQISDATKQVWDPTATITVKDGGTPVNTGTDPYTINRLTGTVSFTNTAARTITIDGTYLPMTTIAKTKEVLYMTGRENLDDTTFDSNGWEESIQGRGVASATLGRNWEYVSGLVLQTAIVNGSLIALEIYDNRNGTPVLMWARATKQAQTAAVKSIVSEALDFASTTDADGRAVSIA